jgi:spore cortex biosynthesis protein YabQ
MVGAGVYLAASYDTYNRLRVKKQQWLTLIQDLIFWIFNVLFIFIWLKEINEGEMRIYIFLSLFCGYAMYRALLERIYRGFLERVIQSVISLYRFFLQLLRVLIIRPIVWIYKLLIAIALFVIGVIVQVGTILLNVVKFLFRPFIRFFLKRWRNFWGRRRKLKEENIQETPSQKRGFLHWVAKRLFKKKS